MEAPDDLAAVYTLAGELEKKARLARQFPGTIEVRLDHFTLTAIATTLRCTADVVQVERDYIKEREHTIKATRGILESIERDGPWALFRIACVLTFRRWMHRG